jgi:hypothetical protein
MNKFLSNEIYMNVGIFPKIVQENPQGHPQTTLRKENIGNLLRKGNLQVRELVKSRCHLPPNILGDPDSEKKYSANP